MSGGRRAPRLIHIRAPRKPMSVRPGATTSGPASTPLSSEDASGRAVPFDVVRRDLQAGALARETEVFYPGVEDWTPAADVAELWVAPPPPEADEPAEVDAPASVEAAASQRSPTRRRSFGAVTVLGAVFGLVALLGAGLYAIYFVYFRYVPVAVQHLPNKCVVAARVDLVDWAFFGPLSKKVEPAIEDALQPKPSPAPPPGPPGPTLKERLRARAGLNADGDLREVAICVFQDGNVKGGVDAPDPLGGFRMVVALGGRIRPGSIPGIYEAIRSEGWGATLKLEGAGEAATIRVPGAVGGVIGQADDGTLLFAPDDATLAKIREARAEEEALLSTGLLQQGSLEIAARHVAFAFGSAAMSPTRLVDQATIDAIGAVQEGRFAIDVGGDPKVLLSLDEKREADARALEGRARHLIGAVQKELAASSRDYAGEQAALASALVRRDELRLDVRLLFRFADVDRGAGELAAMLRDEASPVRLSLDVAVGRRPPPTPAPSASGSASAAPSALPAPSGTAPAASGMPSSSASRPLRPFDE